MKKAWHWEKPRLKLNTPISSAGNAVMEMARQSVEEKLESAEEEIIELSVALAKKYGGKK